IVTRLAEFEDKVGAASELVATNVGAHGERVSEALKGGLAAFEASVREHGDAAVAKVAEHAGRIDDLLSERVETLGAHGQQLSGLLESQREEAKERFAAHGDA